MDNYDNVPKRFYRKCHVCGRISQQQNEPVAECGHCAKPMAPFFYFNDQYVSIYSDDGERPSLAPGEYRPLRGLSVCWTEEN